ncbi:MAG TPA: class I SAM-dependent methyltransferase [Ktedonobacteraceae bacterium]|jgi:SAM-dependent methyltransferase
MLLRLTALEWVLGRLNLLPMPLVDTPLTPGIAKALTLACELNLFDTLNERPMTVDELAIRLECQLQGLRFLLNLLMVAGYLSQRGGYYRNRAVARRWLSQDSSLNIAPYIIHTPDIIAIWEHLPEVVRGGGAPVHMPYEDDSSRPEVQAALERHYAGLASLALVLGRELVYRARLPKHATRLLDVGGSHAAYSVLFCRKYAQLHATIVDLPPGIAAGQRTAQQTGMSERLDFVGLDIVRDAFPREFEQSFDVACYFHIAHLLPAEINEQLLARVVRCLVQGGTIIYVDQVSDEAHFSRLGTAMVQLMGLTVSAIGGTCYSFATVKDWLERAGCDQVRRHRLITPGATMIAARKR